MSILLKTKKTIDFSAIKVYNIAAFCWLKLSKHMSEDPKNKQTKDNEWLRRGLMMFAESSGWIAIPVVGGLFLGRWLDEKQGTDPLYFLSITGLAFIISCIGIGITGVKYMKQIDEEYQSKKKISNESQKEGK
jgi:hypothetical protein